MSDRTERCEYRPFNVSVCARVWAGQWKWKCTNEAGVAHSIYFASLHSSSVLVLFKSVSSDSNYWILIDELQNTAY